MPRDRTPIGRGDAHPDFIIRPQPGPQEAFVGSPADVAIIGGAAGGGKTYGLLLEPLRHVRIAKFSSVIFRRTYPQITQARGLWQESQEVYGYLAGLPRQTSLEWIFPGGARIKFAHMQHEVDRLDWKGAQITLIEFDQLEEFTADMFFFLLSRNRSLTGIRPYIRAACNPVPKEHPIGGWLHEFLSWWINPVSGFPIPERSGKLRWFRRGEDDEIIWADSPTMLGKGAKSVTFIPAKLEDNPILEAKDPDYRNNLLALPRVERERLLGGNWLARAEAGKVFNRAWFEVVAAAPMSARRIRYWDKAGTEGGGNYSAGVRMAETGGLYFIEHVVRGQWSSRDRNQVMLQVAHGDGIEIPIWVEQEPGSGGKESAELSIQNLAGFPVRVETVTGDKLTRMGPLSAQAEAGNVKLVAGPWIEPLLSELHNIPDGKYDDQADAAAGAFNKLALGVQGALRLLGSHDGEQAEQEMRRQEAAAVVVESVGRQGFWWPGGA